MAARDLPAVDDEVRVVVARGVHGGGGARLVEVAAVELLVLEGDDEAEERVGLCTAGSARTQDERLGIENRTPVMAGFEPWRDGVRRGRASRRCRW